MQQVPSPTATQRAFTIPNLRLISLFACNTPKKVATLAYVNEIFRETMIDYETAVLIWDKQADSGKYNLRQVRTFLYSCCRCNPSIDWVVKEMLHCPLLNAFFEVHAEAFMSKGNDTREEPVKNYFSPLLEAISGCNHRVVEIIYDFVIEKIRLQKEAEAEERDDDEEEDVHQEQQQQTVEEMIAFENMMAENFVEYAIIRQHETGIVRHRFETALQKTNFATFRVVVEKLEELRVLKRFLEPGLVIVTNEEVNEEEPKTGWNCSLHDDKEPFNLAERIDLAGPSSHRHLLWRALNEWMASSTFRAFVDQDATARSFKFFNNSRNIGIAQQQTNSSKDDHDSAKKFCLVCEKTEKLIDSKYIETFFKKYAGDVVKTASLDFIEPMFAVAERQSFLKPLVAVVQTEDESSSHLQIPLLFQALGGKPRGKYIPIVKFVISKIEQVLGADFLGMELSYGGQKLLTIAFTESHLDSVKFLLETMKRVCSSSLFQVLTSPLSLSALISATSHQDIPSFTLLLDLMNETNTIDSFLRGVKTESGRRTPLRHLKTSNPEVFKAILETAAQRDLLEFTITGNGCCCKDCFDAASYSVFGERPSGSLAIEASTVLENTFEKIIGTALVENNRACMYSDLVEARRLELEEKESLREIGQARRQYACKNGNTVNYNYTNNDDGNNDSNNDNDKTNEMENKVNKLHEYLKSIKEQVDSVVGLVTVTDSSSSNTVAANQQNLSTKIKELQGTVAEALGCAETP